MTEASPKFDAVLSHCYPDGVRVYMQGSAVAELYRKGEVGRIVLLGGFLEGEGKPSMGEAMQRDLLEKGVPQSAILMRPEAIDTATEINIFMSQAAENGWNELASVGSETHMKRAKLIYDDKQIHIPILFTEDILEEISGLYRNFVNGFKRSLPERIFKAREFVVRQMYKMLGEERLRQLSDEGIVKSIKKFLDR